MADGRAPSGQALAVPATPAGAAGFDPSRIVLEACRGIVRRVERYK